MGKIMTSSSLGLTYGTVPQSFKILLLLVHFFTFFIVIDLLGNLRAEKQKQKSEAELEAQNLETIRSNRSNTVLNWYPSITPQVKIISKSNRNRKYSKSVEKLVTDSTSPGLKTTKIEDKKPLIT